MKRIVLAIALLLTVAAVKANPGATWSNLQYGDGHSVESLNYLYVVTYQLDMYGQVVEISRVLWVPPPPPSN